jgi:hypothetical protein
VAATAPSRRSRRRRQWLLIRRRQKLIPGASPDLGSEELGPQGRDLGHCGADVELAPVLYLRMEIRHVGADPSESLAQGNGTLLLQLK